MRAREASLANPLPNPMTTGAKWGIGLGVLAVIGLGYWAYTKGQSSTVNPLTTVFPTASMVPAAQAQGAQPITMACTAYAQQQLYVYDSQGNRYPVTVTACQGTTAANATATVQVGSGFSGTALTANTSYANVPLAYLSTN